MHSESHILCASCRRNIRQAKRLNLWMLHQIAATSPMMTVQARRSDFPMFQHDEQGLADLVELNENHQRVLRDYAHGCPVWIESTHGTSDLKVRRHWQPCSVRPSPPDATLVRKADLPDVPYSSSVQLESLLMIAVESGNRVHCGSVALLRHERVWGIKEWLNGIMIIIVMLDMGEHLQKMTVEENWWAWLPALPASKQNYAEEIPFCNCSPKLGSSMIIRDSEAKRVSLHNAGVLDGNMWCATNVLRVPICPAL